TLAVHRGIGTAPRSRACSRRRSRLPRSSGCTTSSCSSCRWRSRAHACRPCGSSRSPTTRWERRPGLPEMPPSSRSRSSRASSCWHPPCGGAVSTTRTAQKIRRRLARGSTAPRRFASEPMKLVMTLLARDEADIVDAQVAFHLNAGVDYVIATDHRSTDGTTAILERYARAGYLRLLREEDVEYREVEWRTRMARLAASELGADWVINSDADEFWWPRGTDLKEVLTSIPARYGIVRAFW